MKIELRPSLVAVHDDKAGSHATLFVNGKKAPFRDDLSSFDDQHRQYTWVFDASPKEGAEIVFATADRAFGGALKKGEVQLHEASVRRSGEKPTSVK